MKRFLLAGLLALAPLQAHAQAVVVASCGAQALPVGGRGAVYMDAAGNLCINAGGSGGGGTITANSTPTSGFTAGQLLMSDGSLTQPQTNKAIQLGTGAWMQTGTGQIIFSSDGTGAAWTNVGIISTGSYNGGISLGLGGFLGFTHNGYLGGIAANDLVLTTTAKDVLGLSDGGVPTNPTALRVYNTYTDGSNGEWGVFGWQTTPNVLTIGAQANGTGTARPVNFVSNGSVALDLDATVGGWVVAHRSLQANNLLVVGTNVQSPVYISSGSPATIGAAGGTCAVGTKVGGYTAGTVVLSGVCASTNTLTFSGMPTVTNGYVCDAEDRTTRTAGPFIESATTTTGFTLTVGVTSSVANDVLQWKCMGY